MRLLFVLLRSISLFDRNCARFRPIDCFAGETRVATQMDNVFQLHTRHLGDYPVSLVAHHVDYQENHISRPFSLHVLSTFRVLHKLNNTEGSEVREFNSTFQSTNVTFTEKIRQGITCRLPKNRDKRILPSP